MGNDFSGRIRRDDVASARMYPLVRPRPPTLRTPTAACRHVLDALAHVAEHVHEAFAAVGTYERASSRKVEDEPLVIE